VTAPKLFIPGPIQVSERTCKALCQPMIGHRSPDFVALYQRIQPRLQMAFGTTDPVYLSTSSAWGVMEGAIRNLTRKAVLCCMSGAFSDKWLDVAQRSGLEADGLRFDWGTPVDPEALREKLATGRFDVVTLVHNETSTGTMNPLPELMAVIRDFPEVIVVVDTVSSFSALPVPKDELGIDVMLTGSQKALALPPGLALLSVSEKALKRAAERPARGYYFDLLEFQKNHEKGMTPSTPVIPHIYALDDKLTEMVEEEGLDARYERHAANNDLLRSWVSEKGLRLLPPMESASRSLVCVRNDGDWDLKAVNQALRQRGYTIDIGYGKLKGKTFRISSMGNETVDSIRELLSELDAVLAEQGVASPVQ
jgi:aspartate aminotransferase-like enzyme